eukprot:gene2297-4467_t
MANLLSFREETGCPVSYGASDDDWGSGNTLGQIYFTNRQELIATAKIWDVLEGTIEYIAFNRMGKEFTTAEKDDYQSVITSFQYGGKVKVDGCQSVVLENSVTRIQYTIDNKYIFISSFGEYITVYNNKLSIPKQIVDAHMGVRTFELSPLNDYIAFINTDGDLNIRRLRKDNGSLNDEFTGSDALFSSKDLISNTIVRELIKNGCMISWNPREKYSQLAVPSKKGSVYIYTKDDMDDKQWREDTLTCTDETDLNLAVYSPNGAYLAVANLKGVITIWDMQTTPFQQTHCVKCNTTDALLSMGWGQKNGDNYLVVQTSTSIARIDAVLPLKEGSFCPPTGPLISTSKALPKTTGTVTGTRDTTSKTGATEATNKGRLQKISGEASTTMDADDDLEFVESVEEIKRRVMSTRVDVDTAGDIDMGDDEEDEDEDNIDDIMDDDIARLNALSAVRTPVVVHALQSPFQPSSTVLDDKKRRYLAWNHVGTIVLREESLSNRIEIKFSNVGGSNKQEAFSDMYGFTMGALSYEGALFASDPEEPETEDQREDPNRPGSVVYYKAFPGQKTVMGVNEDFTVTLPREEAAQAVAVGAGWTAVATSKRFLRIFSSTGLQLAVMWLKGPVLCMSGNGLRLAVTYHTSMTAGSETPEPSMDILELTSNGNQWRLLASVPVPVSRGGVLSWMGWSADAQYVSVMDSLGLISVLMKYGGWNWIPVMDCHAVRKSIDHKYWPVTIKNHKFIYVLLNGENKPAIHPQPVVSNVTLAPLIAESRDGKDKGVAENTRIKELMWESLKAEHVTALLLDSPDDPFEILQQTCLKYENEADVALLKALNEACRVKKDSVAIDLGRRIRSEDGLLKAVEIANKRGRVTVAAVLDKHLEAVRAAAAALEDNDNNNDNDEQDTEDTYVDENSYVMQQRSPEDAVYADSQRDTQSLPRSSSMGGGISRRISERFDTGNSKPVDSMLTSSTGKSAPKNPFVKSSPLSPDKKRKSIQENMRDLGSSSPSPKRPSLSRTSAVAQEARSKRMLDKNFL